MERRYLNAIAYALPPFSGIAILATPSSRSDLGLIFHAWQSIYLLGYYIAGLLLIEVVALVSGFLCDPIGVFFDYLSIDFQLLFMALWISSIVWSLSERSFSLPMIGRASQRRSHGEGRR